MKGTFQVKVIISFSQLNVKRFKERRKPDDISYVQQPFQSDKFNFTKVKQREVSFFFDQYAGARLVFFNQHAGSRRFIIYHVNDHLRSFRNNR